VCFVGFFFIFIFNFFYFKSITFLNEKGNFMMSKALSGAYEKIKGEEYSEEVKELCYRLMDRVVSYVIYCFVTVCFLFLLRMHRIDQQPGK
jgi:hypothetical protein